MPLCDMYEDAVVLWVMCKIPVIIYYMYVVPWPALF